MHTNIVALSVIFSLRLVQCSLADTTFSDGTFDAADWSLTAVANNFAVGDVPVEQIGAGGNPGEYRKVTNYVETASPVDKPWIFGFHEFNSAVYDPSLSGGILSLDFSIDFMNIDVFGNGQGVGLALEQDGDLYFAGINLTTAAGVMLNTWQSLSVPTIVESDFTRVDPALGDIRSSAFQPDLSASGSPVVFGFHTFNSLPPGAPVGTANTLIVGYDNWEVVITAVPEPLTFVPFDIKPGSSPNSVNLKSKGVLPVAILGTDDFDVNEVDITTLLFGDPVLIDNGGTAVSPLRNAYRDVSGDGFLDLTLKFSTRDLVEFGALGFDTVEGLLTGELLDGTPFAGLDSIRIVPPNGSKGRSKGNSLQISTVPEPTTSALALAAFCLAMSRRRAF